MYRAATRGHHRPGTVDRGNSGAKAAIQRRIGAAAALALNLHLGCPPTPMLSKVCASWLIVLVLLPFTAPFSMFDLTELLSGQSVDSLGAPSSTTPTAALTRAALSRAVPFPLRAARHRPAPTRLACIFRRDHRAGPCPRGFPAPWRSTSFTRSAVRPFCGSEPRVPYCPSRHRSCERCRRLSPARSARGPAVGARTLFDTSR